ncbi:hypothetical protein [Streptomyces sp. NPDC001774]
MSDGVDGPGEGPLVLSPAVGEILFHPHTPADMFSAICAVMVALREALELGVLPPDAMPVPGVPGTYLSPMRRGLG